MASNTQADFTSETVEGVIYLIAGAGGNGDLNVANLIDVTGSATFRSTLTVVGTGLATLGGALTVAGTVIHNGITTLNGAVTISGTNTLTVGTGLTTLGGALTISGLTTNNGAVSITGTNTLTVGTGLTTLGGALTVAGLTTNNGNVSITGTNTLTIGTGLTTTAGLITSTNTTTVPSTGSTPSGSVTLSGGLALLAANLGNTIMFNTNGLAVPTTVTSRSIGTRLVIYPSFTNAVACDFAIGVASGSMWYSTGIATDAHAFYNGSLLTLSVANAVTTFGSNNIVSFTNSTTSPTSGTAITASVNLAGGLAFTGTSGMKGNISFAAIGDFADPTCGTLSTGTRINFFPAVSSTSPGYNIGIGNSSMWFSVDTTAAFRWYIGNGTATPFQIVNFDIAALRLYATTAMDNSNLPTGGLVMNCAMAFTGSAALSNCIVYNPVNNAEPTSTTIRSVGAKIIFWPNNGIGTDYAMGIGSNSMWYQVDAPSSHNFYAGITNIGLWNSSTLFVNTALSVTGFTSGPSTTNANTQLYIYEDMVQTTVTTVTLAGSATYLQSNYIQLTPATATQVGFAYVRQDPGSSWTAQFDCYFGGGTGADGLQFFVQQTALPSLRANNGGWALCMDELNNLIVGMSPAQTTTASVGKTSDPLTTWLTTATWATIIVTFQQGTFRVYINNVYVPNLTFAKLPVAQPAATYMGFVGATGGSTNLHRIRNVRVEKGVGNNVPVFGTTATWNTPIGIINVANTTAATSSTSGCATFGGGIGVAGALYIGGALNIGGQTTHTSTTTIATNDIALTAADGSVNIAGDLVLSNATSQMIGFRAAGAGAPAFTNRTLGTKLILTPAVTASTVDHAIGVSATALWLSASAAAHTIDMYSATTLNMQVSNTIVTVFPASTIATNDIAFTAADGALNVAGDLVLSNATSQMIGFRAAGAGAPALTNRSLGTKLILKPTVSGTQTDTALGVTSTALWLSNGIAAGTIDFYSVATLIMSLSASTLTLSTGMSIILPKTTSAATLTPTTNGSCGSITTTSLTTAAGGTQAITWTNSTITTTSIIILTCFTAGTGVPLPLLTAQAAGSATIALRNVSTTAAFNNTIRINFLIV